MPTDDLQELMDLMGVNRTKLAAMIDVTANTIDRWFMAGRVAGGPASILLKEWLERERTKHKRNGRRLATVS